MTIDKDCWCPGYPGLLGIHDILIKFLSDLGRGHVTLELAHLEPKFDSDLFNCLVIESRQGKKGIMKFPEFPLLPGCQGGAGRWIGKLMHAQGQILEDDLDGIRIFFEHLLEERQNLAAVRSLEIGKDRDGHRGLGQTKKG